MEYLMLDQVDMQNNLNDRVFVVFLAKDVKVLPQKGGSSYISVTMKCRDVELNAKRFNATQSEIEQVKAGKVYNAAVDIKPYDKSPSGWACVIYNIEENVMIASNAFIKWADGLEGAADKINEALKSTGWYLDITYTILKKYWSRLFAWAAASSIHHNLPGGLAVHTVEVVEQCRVIGEYWNRVYGNGFIDICLLTSASLLHDVGKILELSVDLQSGDIGYSTGASLSTHIMEMLSEIDIAAYELNLGRGYGDAGKSDSQIAFEKERIALLKHCIASHHGKLEYGSPISPSIPEAVLLNKMDELSAEMFRYNKEYKDITPGESSTSWSSGGMRVTYRKLSSSSIDS